MVESSPLLRFLADHASFESLNAEEFSLLMAEARSCGVLGRLAAEVLKCPESSSLSAHVTDQLVAATTHSSGFFQDVWRELSSIERALQGLGTPVIVLKGASYVLLDLPPANGRIFSDVDILVSENKILEAEAALMLAGWAIEKMDPYDQRYYREWSHEIPPMTHLQRGTTIDLHHSLQMPTCRIKVNSSKMILAAVPAKGHSFWHCLHEEDMVLHAVSHLMLNSEFDRGLRDLWDIHLLYRHFTAASPQFSNRLFVRAQEVGMATLLRQAMGLISRIFARPPPSWADRVDASLFLWFLGKAATTRHPVTRPSAQATADWSLMMREMYLRLPPKLLAVHAWHKLSGLFERPKKAEV